MSARPRQAFAADGSVGLSMPCERWGPERWYAPERQGGPERRCGPESRRLRGRRRLLGLFGTLALSACSVLPSARDGDHSPEQGQLPQRQGRISEEQARELTFLALSLVDTPYRWGGNTPQSGFDCSGLIVYVFRESAGYALPRTVKEIARVGHPVRANALRTGDLVFFDAPRRFSHAGIYVGSGRFVHAPSSGGRVRLDGVFETYWRPRLSRIRRV